MDLILKSNGKLPYRRSINSISHTIEILKSHKIPLKRIFEGTKLLPNDLSNPEKYIQTEEELQLLRNIQRVAQIPELGLLLGKEYHIGLMGDLGMAAMLSNTLYEALKLLFKYTELTLTFFEYELFVKGGYLYLNAKELLDLSDLRIFLCEREFSSIIRFCSDILGTPLKIKLVSLTYEKPKYINLYKEIFNCPVEFGKQRNQFVIDANHLHQHLPKANGLLQKKYAAECNEKYNYLRSEKSLYEKVNERFRINGIENTMEEMAKKMKISTRTLRRRLKNEGITYKHIANDIIKNKAFRLLESTNLSIEKISEKLGYSDPANFYHAFKNWTGTTPRKFREDFRNHENSFL
ncbi:MULTISPECIES: AraC family transcriptional regulator [Leptospira]|uniref:AraC family transcriptional regulator n=1 Tax=Leptospira brenneri TaxID=2023182 RepID=A0A2M9Y0G5_9LEPT|nr:MULTISPECIES: AraC family transcriptional regulator [Leptospira]PJZ44893.1 hypothetical protein CH361_11590 [Leptospira brenneri]PJZ79283.1 hypothetical protein CH359_18540 [Leptospira meyeri]PJZ95169.1 hypothetical protein CH358_18805 [Leptospira meyeri]TGK95308.1 AraC family transcriptional regulator [Leptospira brenneri]